MRISIAVSAVIAAVVVALTGLASASPARAGSVAPKYGLLKTFAIGGDGGWDYLSDDSAAHRLYVSRATHVMVIDTRKGNVVGDIPNTDGVHGIAIDRKDGFGFVSCGKANAVTVFSLADDSTVATVTVGTKPDCIIYDPFTDAVFAIDGGSHDATVIDGASHTVKATIPLDGKPEYAVSDGDGKVYVNIEDKSEIQEIDAVKLTAAPAWSIAPCESPSGLAMDRVSRRLFSVCDNGMMAVVDADSGRVVATPAIGEGPDACAFDPAFRLAFSPNGHDGTITVVHEDTPDTYTVIQTVTTQKSARTFALDPANHHLYMSAGTALAPPADASPHTHATIVPGSFVILDVGPVK